MIYFAMGLIHIIPQVSDLSRIVTINPGLALHLCMSTPIRHSICFILVSRDMWFCIICTHVWIYSYHFPSPSLTLLHIADYTPTKSIFFTACDNRWCRSTMCSFVLPFWAHSGIVLLDSLWGVSSCDLLTNELSIEVMRITFGKEYLVAVLIHYMVFIFQ